MQCYARCMYRRKVCRLRDHAFHAREALRTALYCLLFFLNFTFKEKINKRDFPPNANLDEDPLQLNNAVNSQGGVGGTNATFFVSTGAHAREPVRGPGFLMGANTSCRFHPRTEGQMKSARRRLSVSLEGSVKRSEPSKDNGRLACTCISMEQGPSPL